MMYMETNHTTDCDNHARQIAIPNPDGGACWICEDCMEVCGAIPAEFEVGQTFHRASACDSDCIFTWTVTKRTAKFVTLEDDHGKTTRVGIRTDERGEWTMPQGTFSMAPTIHAKDAE